MPNFDIYMYGMTVLSTIHLLKDKFPPADAYQEILQTFVIPGGEGANGALVLKNLGVSVRLDGCYLGELTAQPLVDYLTTRGVDCSLLKSHYGFPGWRDIVFCDGKSRTVFGWFADYFSRPEKLWAEPDEDAIRTARCVGIDPFFPGTSEKVAELCRKHVTDYVTIDCKWDSPMAQGARALVCSREFLENTYPGADPAGLFEAYQRACQGLVIFTFGSRELWYAPHDEPLKTCPVYQVQVVDTLAAGDTFRAGVIYAILKQMSPLETVRFASATAAISCTRFPSVYQPPDLSEIQALMEKTFRTA
jgi:sugar/nucleoside kinase (ribokinase family)